MCEDRSDPFRPGPPCGAELHSLRAKRRLCGVSDFTHRGRDSSPSHKTGNTAEVGCFYTPKQTGGGGGRCGSGGGRCGRGGNAASPDSTADAEFLLAN